MTTTTERPARYVRLSGGATVRVGALAGASTPHDHVPDGHTGSSCMACFGWHDDPRHGYSPVRVPENTGKHPGESAYTRVNRA